MQDEEDDEDDDEEKDAAAGGWGKTMGIELLLYTRMRMDTAADVIGPPSHGAGRSLLDEEEGDGNGGDTADSSGRVFLVGWRDRWKHTQEVTCRYSMLLRATPARATPTPDDDDDDDAGGRAGAGVGRAIIGRKSCRQVSTARMRTLTPSDAASSACCCA